MNRVSQALANRGVLAALGAAVLFGVGAPLAKVLLARLDPRLLAGLLYAGSGVGLSLFRVLTRQTRVRPTFPEMGWLGIAVFFGGVVAPVMLMYGLAALPASSASLFLNAEGVITALLAWIVFRENVDRRVLIGMMSISLGALALSWSPQTVSREIWPIVLVLGACLAWAIDNNVTRKVSLLDATWLAAIKGLVAGGTNIAIAHVSGVVWPPISVVAEAMGIGALAYGVSLVLFVIGLRHLGTARTGAYFSLAPFIGAVLSVIWLGDPVTAQLVIAFVLMGLGVWLHLTERHVHGHWHPEQTHHHEHVHDEHHQHTHDEPVRPGVRHSHEHRHEPMSHTHHHYPDSHHGHSHDGDGK